MRLTLLGIAALAAVSLAGSARAQEAGRWEPVIDLPSGSINAVTFAGDAAWAAGAGAIFHSADGGRTWATVRVNSTFLTDIEAAPAGRRGWAVGVLGEVLATADGGLTWTDADAGTRINLNQVEAFDETTLLVSGIGEGLSDVIIEPQPTTFRRSTDGGATWREIALPDYRVSSIDALAGGDRAWATATLCRPLPPDAGFGCAERGDALFRSDDRGATWSLLLEGRRFRELTFVSEDVGWAVEFRCADQNDYGTCQTFVVRTDNGGETWSDALSLARDAGVELDATSASTAVAMWTICQEGGCSSNIQRTIDAGETWQTLTSAQRGFSGDLVTAPPARGLIAQSDGIAWSDDLATWHRATLPLTTGSGAYDFVDADTGWFAASKLLRTDDAGATVTPVSDFQPDVIDFIDEHEGWATDLVCDPACGNTVEIRHTTDGGRTWQMQSTQALGNYLALSMRDARNGWAHSLSDRLLLRTADGGLTWQPVAFPEPAPVVSNASIAFTGAATAWFAEGACEAGYENCRLPVWVTTDGGASWRPVAPVPAAGECPVQLSAIDARTAWLVTYECRATQHPILFRTTDGGASWRRVDFAQDGQVSTLTFFDRLNGRGVRAICPGVNDYCDAAVMRTADGGLTWSYEPVPAAEGAFNGFFDHKFVTPERAYSRVQRGGGLFAEISQSLYRYTGNRPNPIILPDTGDGTRREGGQARTLLLLGGAISAAAAAVVLRRRGGIALR